MKLFEGIVVSKKLDKMATVLVERKKVHPIYKKGVKSTKKYHVHDEIGVKLGNKVKITETRPMSRTKRWKIVEVVK